MSTTEMTPANFTGALCPAVSSVQVTSSQLATWHVQVTSSQLATWHVQVTTSQLATWHVQMTSSQLATWQGYVMFIGLAIVAFIVARGSLAVRNLIYQDKVRPYPSTV